MTRKYCKLLMVLLPCIALAQDAHSVFVAAGQSLQKGECAEATDLLLRSLRLFQTDPATPAEQIGLVWQSLGTAYRCRKLYSKAERAYQKAMESEGAGRKAEVLASLAAVYGDMGRIDAALDALQNADQILRSDPHPDPGAMALLLDNRGVLEGRLGHKGEAEDSLRRALDLAQKGRPHDVAFIAYLENNIAEILSEQGKYGEAARHCSTGLAVSEGTLPPDRQAAMEEACAFYLRRSGNPSEALRLMAHAKQLRAHQKTEPGAGLVVDASQLLPRK